MKRFVCSALLSSVLLVPIAATAEDHDKHEKKYYDAKRHDYHEWNEAEARAYRHWLMEERREKAFRDYNRIKRDQQEAYWEWRHSHPDWH